jgi:hypothetical protein
MELNQPHRRRVVLVVEDDANSAKVVRLALVAKGLTSC